MCCTSCRLRRSSSKSSVAVSSHCKSARNSVSGCSGCANTAINRRNTNWNRRCASNGGRTGTGGCSPMTSFNSGTRSIISPPFGPNAWRNASRQMASSSSSLPRSGRTRLPVSGCRNPDKSGGGCRGPEGPRGRRDDWVLGVGRSDERVVGVVWRVMLGCGWSVLLTSFLEQLHAVVISDHFLEVVEELEDGKSLFRGPVRGNGEGDREQQAGRSGRFHDLVFRRLRARCSARSRASLARYESPSMTTISELWTRRSTKETTQAAFGNTSLHSTKGRFVVT